MDDNSAPNWSHVAAFLGLTFGLTWLLDLAIYLHGGLNTPGIATILQFQMLLPAFSAILLGMFVFEESPIYHRRRAGRGRWFYYYFLALVVLYALGALATWLASTNGSIPPLAGIVPQILAFLGLVVLIVVRLTAGREATARVWLAWGNWRYWLFFGLAFIGFYVLQAVLNGVTGLGGAKLAPLPSLPKLSPSTFLILGAVQSVLLAPFLAIVLGLGEEYGWRGYLQHELVKLGRIRGVLLVGLIWGMWHWPIILMGFDYPAHRVAGLALMALNTIGLAVVLGLAVLKSGSVLLAAYLHALLDQTVNFLAAIGFRPFDPAIAFGTGVLGIACVAVVALLLLRDPIWHEAGGSPPLNLTAPQEGAD